MKDVVLQDPTLALPGVDHYLRPGTLQITPPPLSLYIHLPWCLHKCPYCDFNSHGLAQGETVPDQRYVQALIADLEAALPYVWGRKVHSIFIGGGTPSLFSPERIDELLGAVRARVMLEPGAEVTLEANPGTFERDRFRGFAQAGVTRLSVGVQSFDDQALKALGRVHDARQAWAAVEEAAKSFETFNIDLMYALPGQNLAQCELDVLTALSLTPPHLSIYHLTLEPNTVFARHPPALPDDDLAYQMMDVITQRTGEAGLHRYEVSAYAKAGHRCVHNLNYWNFGDYLGLGAGAHSKLSFPHRVVRQVRWREPAMYMSQALAGRAVSNSHEVGRESLAFEFMLNALRLVEGFDVQNFLNTTGLPANAIEAALTQAVERDLLTRDLQRVRPTTKGLDFLSDLQAMFL